MGVWRGGAERGVDGDGSRLDSYVIIRGKDPWVIGNQAGTVIMDKKEAIE